MNNGDGAHISSPSVILVDDDDALREVLSRAFMRRGYEVITAASVEAALQLVADNSPEYAVVDLKMPGDSGLVLVKTLKALDEQTRIVMLTGYSSIATAVEAIKLGATHYLAKPADADDIIAAFARGDGDAEMPVSDNPMTVERLEWEHIQKVLTEHEGNVSATARALRMHRRTLQRKLAKRPVKE
ncbi:MAG TPA: response regulator transcription factor [Pseudomonadales bacterium]